MEDLNKYIDYLKNERKYPDTTISSYINDITLFNKYLVERKINYLLIDKDIVRNYLKYLDSLKYKNNSISRMTSSIRSFYTFLVLEKKVPTNPLKLIRNPKKEKKLPNFLQYDEFIKVIESIKKDSSLGVRNNLILELLYATGLRASELISIKLNDIDYNNHSIKVVGKGSKERIVFFGDYAYDALKDYINNYRLSMLKNNKSNYLFINNRGTNLTRRGLEQIIDEIVNKSLIKHKISPHVLRHTFATSMLENGADIKTVQELLGHASLSTTQIYTHVTNELLRSEYFHAFPRQDEKATK